MPEVEVGPFWVNDSPRDELVDHVVDLCLRRDHRPAFAYALHVGGLNARRERDFVVAMRQADVVYADGGSVVWLARLAGGNRVERAPTTDIGWEVMRGFAAQGRPAAARRPDRRARRVWPSEPAAVLADAGVAEVVLHRPRLPPATGTSPLAAAARGLRPTSRSSASARPARWSGASSTATSSRPAWC